MTWDWKRRRHPSADQVEALQAREAADRQLAGANDMHAEALTLAEALHEIRRRNHFGQSLENLNWSKR